MRNARGVLNIKAFKQYLTEIADAIKTEWARNSSEKIDPVEAAKAREALQGVTEKFASPIPEWSEGVNLSV